MVDDDFIKMCKNFNIKNSKGFKYETIIKRSINKIKKLFFTNYITCLHMNLKK